MLESIRVKVRKNYKVLEFRLIKKNDIMDDSYPHWSRKYEYPMVMDVCKKIFKNEIIKIHNTCWGFDVEHHQRFKEELESCFYNSIVLSSDIYTSSLKNTLVYDIRKSPQTFLVNFFNCVINISAFEEVDHCHIEILNNLLAQLKDGGYLIVTFDLPGFQLDKIECFLGQRMNVDGNKDDFIFSEYFKLNTGILVLQK